MRHTFVTFTLLLAAWLIWSGHFTPLLLAFGVASCIAVIALTLRMKVVDDESQPYHLGLRPLAYLPWLLWQITKSNFDVARIILDPRLPISPRLIEVPLSQKTAVGQVGYANSITLTPGTITIGISQGQALVHALTRQAAADLLEGTMDRRAARLEGDS